MPLPIGWGLRNRFTGEWVGPIAPIYPSDFPFKYPSPSQLMWRYLDLAKFEDMLRTRSIYFARADRFTDQLEGKFTPSYTAPLSPSAQALHNAYNLPYDPVVKESAHETTRQCTFVSCWHMSGQESQRMWDTYTESSESVVIRSTGNALLRFVGDNSILKSCVKYQGNDAPRTEFSHLSLFLYKPIDCSFECEFRMIRPMALDGTESVLSDNPADFGRRVPIRLGKIIKQVITHPKANQMTKDRILTLLTSFLPSVKRRDSLLG